MVKKCAQSYGDYYLILQHLQLPTVFFVCVQSYSGLRGAVAFALALVRISDEAELRDPHNQELSNELKLRQSMLTAITALVFFTVFIQVTLTLSMSP